MHTVEVVPNDGDRPNAYQVPADEVDGFVTAMDGQLTEKVIVTSPDGETTTWRWSPFTEAWVVAND